MSKVVAGLLCICLLWLGISNFPLNIFSWDVFGYYLYLPLTFIYHDLGIRDVSIVNEIIEKYHNTGTFYQALPAGDTGNMIMRYGIGLAVLYSPFFFIGHLLAASLSFPTDGFSLPYQYAVWSGCMLYTFAGIIMLRKCLLIFFNELVTSIVLIIMVLGTNYTLHSSMFGQGSMTHNYLFTLYAFILWFTIRWHEEQKLKYILGLAISSGLAVIVRPSEMICLIIPVVWGVYNTESFNKKIKLLIKNKKQLFFFSLLFVSICFIQLTYWKIYSGSFWFDSYYNPGEGLDLFPPHTINFLFSFRNGWFIYTPLIVFAFLGFIYLYKYNKQVFFSLFLYTIINLWVVSSWTVWWYGECFSQRGIIASYIVLSVPMGYLVVELTTINKNLLKYSVLGIFLLLILLNLFQTWQTARGILFSPRATAKFWLAVFGRTSPLPNAEKLLYMDWPTNGEEHFTNKDEYRKTHTWKIEFEANEEIPKERLDTLIVHSGKSAYKFDSITEFGPGISRKYFEITDKYHAWIKASVWIYPVSDITKNPVNFVTTFIHKGKAYKYKGFGTDQFKLEMNTWNHISVDYLSPIAIRSANDLLQVYIWNSNKMKFYVDDLEVQVFEPARYPYY